VVDSKRIKKVVVVLLEKFANKLLKEVNWLVKKVDDGDTENERESQTDSKSIAQLLGAPTKEEFNEVSLK
jgi:hypothetical protein